MHELSIADAVATIVGRHAGDRRVTRVELRVGHLRQVVPDALTFAWELVTQGTPAERAELAIEQVPATVVCRACESQTTLRAFPAQCTDCGSIDVDVAGGDELIVDALELEEEDALTRSGG